MSNPVMSNPVMSNPGATPRITPVPTDEEAAAIIAAVDACWPQPVVKTQTPTASTAWRFSGRWWSAR